MKYFKIVLILTFFYSSLIYNFNFFNTLKICLFKKINQYEYKLCNNSRELLGNNIKKITAKHINWDRAYAVQFENYNIILDIKTKVVKNRLRFSKNASLINADMIDNNLSDLHKEHFLKVIDSFKKIQFPQQEPFYRFFQNKKGIIRTGSEDDFFLVETQFLNKQGSRLRNKCLKWAGLVFCIGAIIMGIVK